MTEMVILDLDQLNEEIPALTNDFAGYLRQAILMCLQEHFHSSGVACSIKGLSRTIAAAEILWSGEFSTRIARLFGAPANAAEYAGEGIAILTILTTTDYTILERSNKGTGIDFWLGHRGASSEENFQRSARMEAKGRTRLDRESQIRSEVRKGLIQAGRSDDTNLPVYVILTEFSRPIIYMVQT